MKANVRKVRLISNHFSDNKIKWNRPGMSGMPVIALKMGWGKQHSVRCAQDPHFNFESAS